ncbi:bifunctional UDP-N-acetylmuramoyl-tripeptide:D-alanyl-D-alanine ligase/alanine racemase [Labilibacter sediminis]|nr:bifunctional UDP-N-acetylmuramoyl-tripeptide:D-alanyl-D-alanine ligase/alanine racemase [Labilibacter sediminis]
MQLYSFKEVSGWIAGKLIQSNDIRFSYLITDSRTLIDAEKSFFIAIVGENHNGHDYIPSLYRRGVRCFMVNEEYVIDKEMEEAHYLVVKDTMKGFQQLAAHKRGLYSCPVIGITGSNGKTIVKEWVSQLIGKSKVVVRSPKSYNSQVGVPLSVWQLHSECEIGIFEAGISQKGEMEKIAPVISPTIGVITNIGAAHQENFTSEKEKLKEKLQLFETCEVVLFSADAKLIQQEIKKYYPEKNCLSWGLNESADIQVSEKLVSEDGTRLAVKYMGEEFNLNLPFTDEVSFENGMHAVACMLYLGYEPIYISSAIEKLVPVAMRMELKEGVNNCIIINDSYNSDLSSLALSLDFLVQQSRHKTERRTLVLSDIFQSGIENGELCLKINNLLKQRDITRFIGVGAVLKKHFALFDVETQFFNTTQELLNTLTPNSFKNEAILIKGSRNFEFEKVSAFLEMKHHQTRLEINLNALVDNLNYYRSKLKDNTKVLAMVKAFSYGSGSFEIANVLQHQKVDYLGVAFADEGVELRKAGISLPIIVMNPEVKSFAMMLEHQLEPELYGFKVLHQFADLLKEQGVSEYPVHIKCDTGMNRLGFVSDELGLLIEILEENKELRVKSVFSHLAGSDDKQFDDFTEQQIGSFSDFAEDLEKALGYSVVKHILNSAGILRFPQAQFDMVRLGIGLYGIAPTQQENLKCVTSFKSYISQIKKVKAHHTIGYNRKGELDYDAEIAIVPVGYADGLNRKLGNGAGGLWVNGKIAPVVGNICMDMCMVDVTGIRAEEGDEVEVFGTHISVGQLADVLETIPYEIFTSISRRVKRVYYYE